MNSILNPSFHYTSSVQTDLRKTFDRIRRELPPPQRLPAQAEAGESVKVTPLPTVRRSYAEMMPRRTA